MLNSAILVVIDIILWIIYGVIIGFIASKLSTNFLQKNLFPTSNKTQKRLEKYLLIRKWKDKLPELGATFKDGVSKKQLSMKTNEGVQAFVLETRRAELVHVLAPLICPVYFLYNPLWLAILITTLCVLLNLPFLLIQRFNRARCLHILKS